jgi:hypothetical protein
MAGRGGPSSRGQRLVFLLGSPRRAAPPPRRLRLPQLCAAALTLALAASASAADPARAPPPACVVSAGARSFDLAELGGGGGDGESVVPALRHVSHATESRGWTYSFAACGVVAPLPAACAGAAPGSAALQQTISECFGLGASATRAVAATATGVELSFSGGDGGRSSVITIECADLARPQVVRWGSGAAPGSYTALVRARAGCALECARDASTGAVCGGAANGACVAADGVSGLARCVCAERKSGSVCSDQIIVQDDDGGGSLSKLSVAIRSGLLSKLSVAIVLISFLVYAMSAGLSTSSWLRVRALWFVVALVLLAADFGSAPAVPLLTTSTSQLSLQAPAAAAQEADWSDALLYTPAGHAHDAWRLLSPGQIAPLTAEAQELLIARQFPSGGCAGARFLVSHGDGIAGVGAQIHIATSHLGAALEQGRIFLWSETAGQLYSDPKICPGPLNFECIFRAPSSCSLADARAAGADTVELRHGAGASQTFGYQLFHVPAVMKALWENASRPAPHAMELKFWWRAQGAAFLARLNDETVKALRELRTNRSAIVVSLGAGAAPQHHASSMVGPGWPPAREADLAAGARMAATFPFVRGMTSMHVRHGDKGGEMTLVADEAYFAAAEALVLMNPMGLARAAFISTEDPATLTAASQERRGWALMWYELPRINSNGLDQITRLPLAKGFLTRAWLLQLLMALECDAWVGTRGSNWNR